MIPEVQYEGCAFGPMPVWAETLVRASGVENQAFIGVSGWVSSTAVWGCGYRCDGTASGSVVGLDYFGARYFSGAMGRWTSPDWSATPRPVPYSDLNDPQTLNLYEYVRNNPLAQADADGHCFWDVCAVESSVYAAAVATAGYLASPAGQRVIKATVALTDKAVDVLADGVRAGLDILSHSPSSCGGGLGCMAEQQGRIYSQSEKKTDAAPSSTGNTNPYEGPVSNPVTVVDSKGNAIPVKAGEQLQGSKDGRFTQVKDANGNPTGVRVDGPHKPSSHPDPRAQEPHAHVPGQTNPDGTPWLPIKR